MTTEEARSIPGGERALSRTLIVSFGLAALLAAAICVALMWTLLRVGAELEAVRRDGLAVQEGLGLALSVREHYIHEAHTIIEGDRRQVMVHRDWLGRLRSRASELAPRVPATERGRLRDLVRVSQSLDRVFLSEVLPAALRGDQDSLRRAHRRAEGLTDRAAGDADAVVAALDARMDRARHRAQRASSTAIFTGCVGVGALLLLAIVLSLRIRREIVLPLQTLAGAAQRLGKGEPVPPLGPLGRGEIATVAFAFDGMATALRAREKKLVESERMAAIGQLAAGIAHEVNNPIGIIRGYLHTMLDEDHDPDVLEELRILDEEAQACQRIVEDLLSFARAPQLEARTVETRALLQDAANRAARVGRHRIEVHADAATINADEVRLHQVLANLIRNAIEASPEGPVELWGDLRDDRYRIRVRDYGEGVAVEDRERIFEPFQSNKTDGTGLGLAVCRSIVEAHGGVIYARGPDGGGTEIVVELVTTGGRQ